MRDRLLHAKWFFFLVLDTHLPLSVSFSEQTVYVCTCVHSIRTWNFVLFFSFYFHLIFNIAPQFRPIWYPHACTLLPVILTIGVLGFEAYALGKTYQLFSLILWDLIALEIFAINQARFFVVGLAFLSFLWNRDVCNVFPSKLRQASHTLSVCPHA